MFQKTGAEFTRDSAIPGQSSNIQQVSRFKRSVERGMYINRDLSRTVGQLFLGGLLQFHQPYVRINFAGLLKERPYAHEQLSPEQTKVVTMGAPLKFARSVTDRPFNSVKLISGLSSFLEAESSLASAAPVEHSATVGFFYSFLGAWVKSMWL